MYFGNYLGFIVFGVIVVFIIIRSRKKKQKTLIKDNGQELKVNDVKLKWAKYVEGIPYLSEGQECDLVIDNEKLSIIHKDRTLNISLEQIVNASILTKKEAVMKNKNAVGRGIVGGVLTGGVGLLLGGLSGVGQKVKSKSNYFLIINYKPKDSNEIKIISFGLMAQDNRFVKALAKRISIENNIDL